MARVEVDDVAKTFGRTRVVHGVSLDVASGAFVSLLGPSGCGKTTTLRMVAGFERPSAGRIRLGGRDVTGLRPSRRGVGMVFQSYALFPNLTVAENVGFGLRVARVPRAQVKARVAEMLALVRLPELAGRYPRQLSGGQQQRVALARALAPRPQVLLLDEPLSALDAAIRLSLREEIRALQRQLGITTIYVTHDQEEALSMSDRVAVMNGGRVEQEGPPADIYNSPRTLFVASFVGKLSLLPATVTDPAAGRLLVDGQEIRTGAAVAAAAGSRIHVGLRPEAVLLGPGEGSRNRMAGIVGQASFLGSTLRIAVRFGETAALTLDVVNDPALPAPRSGDRVTVSFTPDRVLVLAA